VTIVGAITMIIAVISMPGGTVSANARTRWTPSLVLAAIAAGILLAASA